MIDTDITAPSDTVTELIEASDHDTTKDFWAWSRTVCTKEVPMKPPGVRRSVGTINELDARPLM